MNRKIYVANLPYQATEPELKALFINCRVGESSSASNNNSLFGMWLFFDGK